MAVSKILMSKRIHESSIQATTGNFGEVNLNMPNTQYIILGAVCDSAGNYLCIPYIAGTANAVTVLSLTSLAHVTSKAVTIRFFYIER